MKKLVALLMVVFNLGCVTYYRYCDPETTLCYDCDGVGCARVPAVTVDAGRTDTARPPTDAPVVPPFCQTRLGCAEGSECIGGVCRRSCTTNNQCQMFDVQLRYCINGICLAN